MISKESLDDEILREIASVGGGYGRKIEYCMERARRIKRALNYLEERIKREKGKIPKFSIRLSVQLRKRFDHYLNEAYKYRYYLIIYRESIGLTNHRPVYEIYNIEELKDE
ncbi:MAG: hypothetical protein DSY32_03890 [Aquifex sp.]|nr:MAG: hypothetical protein DSY32_03890 [Aquifex sp.]